MLTIKYQRFLLSVLSGILLVLSFPSTGSLFFIGFFSLVPLLLVEHSILVNKYRSGKVFIHAYLSFFIYNVGTTWWIYNASPGGAYLAFLLNSFLMASSFYIYHLFKKKLNIKFSLVYLIIAWLGFEYLHYHWELSWPWLTLGNIFSIAPQIIQWYEYTGVLGGSLWLLMVNFLIFKSLVELKNNKSKLNSLVYQKLVPIILLILIPVLFSLYKYYTYEEKKDPVEVALIQPNIDPYNEKFVSNSEDQVEKMIKKSESIITSKTKFVLFPETAISSSVHENYIDNNPSIELIRNFLTKKPSIHVLTGAATFSIFRKKFTNAARQIPNSNEFIEFYNSSLAIDQSNIDIVHKSKLVLGVEKVPFISWLPFLEELSINNGGTSGTLGQEKVPKIISSAHGKYAPVVCYESIYGEFVGQQVRSGAELIFIITNDGWWKDTPGYKQHNSFASIRAIENRRSVARCANTGTSSFVNQRGDMIKKSSWWIEDGLIESLNKNSYLTIYSQYGDLVYSLISYVLLVLIIYVLILSPIRKLIKKIKPSEEGLN
jgi:apolipoprotein N-acyltransferase